MSRSLSPYLIRRTHAVTIDVTRFGRPVPVRTLTHVEYERNGHSAYVVRARYANTGRPVRLTLREQDRAVYRSLAMLV